MPEARIVQDAEAAAAPGAQPRSKRRIARIGAGALAVALGALVATMGLPRTNARPPALRGPFVTKLSKDEIQVNLAGESSKRYLLLALEAEYFAYDERYVTARLGDTRETGPSTAKPREDPLYTAMLKDAILDIASTRTRDQVTDPLQIEALLEDLRRAVDPLLFPVCVGDSVSQAVPDAPSGLKVGESVSRSTLRGLLHEHAIAIDGAQRTLKLDGGPLVGFDGTERDLCVENERGESVFLDVTSLDPEFSGTLPIGAPGKVRRLYRDRFLVQ